MPFKREIFFRTSSARVITILLTIIGPGADAMPLGNWRTAFFKIASDFELSHSSPSGMFWDIIESAAMFDSSIWNSRQQCRNNYWMMEPAVSGGVSGFSEESPRSSFFLHGDIYHEAKLGRILVGQSLDVDGRFDDDEFYPGHPDRFTRGRIEEAFIQLGWNNGFFRIGRQQRSWGPFPDRSCILSSNPYSYDAVEWQLRGEFFEFRHLFSPLSFNRCFWDADDGTPQDRYLTAHSLNFILGKWFTVGVTETVLFTRDGGFPYLQYVNPVSIYSVVNTNQEAEGNLMLGFQWNVRPFTEKVSFRGQIVLDDFQVDNELITDKEPTHWGIDAGLFWYDPIAGLPLRHLVKLELTYASKWLYTVPDHNADKGERYIYGGKSLGLPFNDGMNLRLGILAVPERLGAAEIFFGYFMRGGNNERSRWNDSENIPGLPVESNKPVQRRFAAGVESCWYFKDFIHLLWNGSLGRIQNRNNIYSVGYGFDLETSIELSVHFSGFFIKLP